MYVELWLILFFLDPSIPYYFSSRLLNLANYSRIYYVFLNFVRFWSNMDSIRAHKEVDKLLYVNKREDELGICLT